MNGRGGVIGPDLALATEQRHDKSWIVNHLENPQLVVSGKPISPMGVLPVLLPDQTEALAAYIEELRGGGPYSPLAPVLFQTYCMGCHRLNGHGSTFAPDLSSIGLMRTRSFIHRYIENPKAVVGSARMPSFLTPQGPLTHEFGRGPCAIPRGAARLGYSKRIDKLEPVSDKGSSILFDVMVLAGELVT